MSSGLEWDQISYATLDPRNDIAVFQRAPNPWEEYLGRPLITYPGDAFLYSEGSINVLGEVIRRASGLRLDVEVELEKHLPTAAGLGGGSSDAAAVLRGLAALEPGALDPAQLPELALGLGADVPFFLDPRPALVGGIGERIEPVTGLPPLCLLLANPGVSLATAAVYDAWDAAFGALTPPEPGSTMRSLSRLLTVLRTRTGEGNGAGLESAAGDEAAALLELLLHNDLEPSACGLCPEIAPLQEQIRELGALATGLSGSGASVYGVFASQDAARDACRRLEASLGMREAGKASGGWARVVVTLGEGGGT